MTDIVHQCPPRGSGLMPCCGLSPFEAQGDRLTTNPDLVTCPASWTIPTDDPPLISIMRADQNPLVTIHTDGRMEFGPDYEPDEAARVFWDAVQRLTSAPGTYPHPDGDVTVLGPEIFASSDGKVICWKGENYVPQPDDTDLTEADIDRMMADGTPVQIAPAPAPQLRDQIAAAMADLDCAKFNCAVPDKSHEYWRIWNAQADAVLAVPAIRGLAETRDALRHATGDRDAYDQEQQQMREELARLREWLPTLRRAVSSLPAVCRYHGDQLDPDRFGRMTRSEACCDTGVPARRRREAEQALAALDPQEQPR